MKFKPDWAEARERFTAWWAGSSIDRVALHVTADIPNDSPRPPSPADPQAMWIDAEYRVSAAEHRMQSTYYGGEAFPYFDPNIGPGSLALYIGSPPRFAPDTVWYEPIADSVCSLPELRFDPANEWWQATVRLVEEGMRRGEGRYLTSFPDLVENLDIAASLVGSQQILYDLADSPEEVVRLITRVNELYFECYDRLYSVLDGDRHGSCFSAFSIWGEGRVAKVQCDACAMISPDMFEYIVVPALREQVRRLDYSVYHLDGPDAIKHLDALLRIPELNAIQWTPGWSAAGVGSEQWWPMYRKVRDSGKGLLLLGTAYDEVEPLARKLGSDGVLIGTHAPSVEAANELLSSARKW